MEPNEKSVLLTLRRHWGAVALAILVGVLCVSPYVYFRSTSDYAGLEYSMGNIDEHYLERVREVYDGHATIGNAFLPDKTLSPLMPPLGEWTMAYLGQALGLTPAVMGTFAKFLFPLLAALLIYGLMYTLFRSRAAALIGIAAVMFGDILMDSPSAWAGLLHGISPARDFLFYARPINPEISGLFLFGGLWLMYRALYRMQSAPWYEAVLAGLVAGGALYISPFTASFLLGVITLGGLYHLVHKRYPEAKQAGLAFLAGLASIIPYVLNYLALHASPDYFDAAARQGMALTHAPLLGFWLPILILLVACAWPTPYRHTRAFFLATLASLVLLLNQQILTGHTLEPSHYHWYITKPLIALVGSAYIAYLGTILIQKSWLRYSAYGLVVALLIYNGSLVQASAYRAGLPTALSIQHYEPALSYLATLPREENILADRTLSLYIPLYTHHDAPENHFIPYYLVPQQYLIDRLLLEYKLRGVRPADALATMQKERVDIAQRLFGVYIRDQFGAYEDIPDAWLKSYATQYEAIYQDSFANLFKRFGITLLVYDAAQDQEWQISRTGLTKLFANGGITIYRL